jgi:hypothetical protein
MNDLERFARELQRRSGRKDAPRVTSGLNADLNVLNDLLFRRLQQDVESVIGTDSMLVPASALKSRLIAKNEIALYQIAESAATVRQRGYLPADADWYVPWLGGLQLGEIPLDRAHRQRIDGYLSKTDHERQLALTDVLVSVLRESRRAPLVLFLLFPLAIRIATATAFGDDADAKRLRASQVELLPIISDCRECQGQVLDPGRTCGTCSNPLWKTEWLNAVE